MTHDEYVAARRAGICPRCHQPAVEGRIYCAKCASVESERQHINYIKRKFGVTRDVARMIAREGIVERRPDRKHALIERPQPKQTFVEIETLAEEASRTEHRYVSYGEIVARQSEAYNWKIPRRA